MLIPSGNNIAETLARWDAGSIPAFVAKMNQRAAALHLTRTTFADPAGVSAQTVSTPSDLVALGMVAMQQAALAQIVAEPQTTLPVAGTVYNVNSALGQSGIIGIKTGFDFSTGATFLFAASATIDGRPVTLFGCVMGQPTLAVAFDAAENLIGIMQSSLKMRPIVTHDDIAGAYDTAWGSHSNLLATQDVTMVAWPGMVLHETLQTPTLAVDVPVASGTQAGTMHVVLGGQQADVPLVTATTLDPPGFAWRVSRINW
jgi:D-alanyl-D-alanine carboxypeptidase (penicillin-binding protein 5/6)